MIVTSLFLTIFLLAVSLDLYAAGANGDTSISNKVGVSELVITTCNRVAGAICSMKWKGIELVDDFDHGRQIQTAITYDRLGEGYNPTEAGSKFNSTYINSTSHLNWIKIYSDSLESETVLAFWLHPNECTTDGRGACAVNMTRRSKTVVNKKVTIGYENMPHVVEMLVDVTLEPKSSRYLIDFNRSTFKIMSGHFRGDLNNFYTYDRSSKQLISQAPTLDTNSEYTDPVVISNDDGSVAIAYYTPDELSSNYTHHYNMSYFTNQKSSINQIRDITKLVNVYRMSNPEPGSTHSFRAYMAISSKQNITNALEHLTNHFE